MLYRIITENKVNSKDVIIHAMAAQGFEGYTMIKARGYWKGVAEKSIIVEVCGDDKEIWSGIALRIIAAARLIKAGLQQEAVLIQEIPCRMEMV